MSGLLLALVLTGGIDESVYEDIRHGWKGPVQDIVMQGATVMTDWPALIIADAALGLAGDEKLCRISCQAFVSWAGAGAIMMGIRALVNRPRPETRNGNWWASAFPSGHATGYFAMAAVYAVRYPKLRWPLVLGGVLVGFSRIYLGEHYPSDVLAGAALGTGVGALTSWVWPECGFSRATDDQVRMILGSREGNLCVGLGVDF